MKPGGKVFETLLIYDAGSETSAFLESSGCINSSRERFESFVQSVGFSVEYSAALRCEKEKLDPGDFLPLNEADGWADMAYILKK